MNRIHSYSAALNEFTCIFAVSWLLVLAGCIQAMALDVPPLKARVNDYDGLLSTGTRNLLEEQLKQLEQEDSTQVVIVTITSLKGENLEQYSLKVAETWGIGQKGADNGVLLLIAVNDRKIRIEVGYGLEGVLTDVVAGRIIRNVITPKFRKGQFDAGVINGVAAIVGTVKGEFNTESLKKASDADPALWIIGGMFGFFTIGSIFRKKTIIAGIAGGVYSTLLGLTAPFISGVTSLLTFALVGVICGVIASSIISSRSRAGSSRTTGFSDGFNTRGGGFGGGFGGFGGGGGGFGGGGASGGW